MDFKSRNLEKEYWPELLKQIAEPPKSLRIIGNYPNPENIRLCVIGPRKYSEYSKAVCEKLISELAGYPITIVSGLAYGIDSIAHKSALKNNLETIAILGSGLGERYIYPRAHFNLAKEIFYSGGSLISEFPDDFSATKYSFPQRNRIMVGMSEATLVIETREKSGTMITTRLTLDYNNELMTIPGSIFNESCTGANNLIKEGAHPVTCGKDILEILGIEIKDTNNYKQDLSENENLVIENLKEPITDENLIIKTKLSIAEFNETLTLLEVKNLIQFVGGKICQK